jgi:hypothetical protein
MAQEAAAAAAAESKEKVPSMWRAASRTHVAAIGCTSTYYVVCCALSRAHFLLHVVCYMLPVAACLLLAVYCTLHVVRCSSSAALVAAA